MKKVLLPVCIVSLLLTSCGGNGSKEKSATDSSTEVATANATIKDDQLYPFLLGGVYFFHGYGGGQETQDKIIKPGVQSKPGDGAFLDDLHTVYTEYFIFPFKPEDGAGIKSTLADAWDITDKTSFLKTQEELLTNGHQAKFLALSADGAVGKDELEKEQLAFVQTHKAEFPKQGIKAWDIARYVNNTAMGYAAGYLTKDEANAALAKLAPLVKGQYADWAEYWKSYNLGRKFWAGDEENDAAFDKTSADMQQGDYSIYKYVKL